MSIDKQAQKAGLSTSAYRAAVCLQNQTKPTGIGDLHGVYAVAERYALDASFEQLYAAIDSIKIPRESDKEARTITLLGSPSSIGRISIATEIDRGTGSFEGQSFLGHVIDAPTLGLRAHYSLPWESRSEPQESLGPQDSFWVREQVDGAKRVLGRVYVLNGLAATVRSDIQLLIRNPEEILARADGIGGTQA